ncbi:hypothetical protein BpHYR1_012050 [Brachionus plicatilis]|uniref:Uncharacterized protein n=1 Tax=Brachionus plicatilis TaxID=10195 RepID=A0A3M7SVA8_BRAPC|nr:hypothetical protein BpHYR1_012050 [Brachionus plicatilis]
MCCLNFVIFEENIDAKINIQILSDFFLRKHTHSSKSLGLLKRRRDCVAFQLLTTKSLRKKKENLFISFRSLFTSFLF